MRAKLSDDQRGATAIEYGLIAALVALAFMSALPGISHSIEATLVTAREGLKGKVCESDPTAQGTQCH